MAPIIGAAVYPGDCDILYLAQARAMKIMDAADVANMMYQSLKAYPCRCTFARMPNGQPIFKEGERVLESQCSRCETLAAYEKLHG